jgi:phage terminase large subunit-like protein
MPWQQTVADVGFEINPETGLMAYREIVVTVMRQNGKTQLVLATESERCMVWEDPQRVIYTAQTGSDARDKLLEDQVPLLSQHLGKYIRRV